MHDEIFQPPVRSPVAEAINTRFQQTSLRHKVDQ